MACAFGRTMIWCRDQTMCFRSGFIVFVGRYQAKTVCLPRLMKATLRAMKKRLSY